MERTFKMLNRWLEENSTIKLTDDQYESLEILIYEYADQWEGNIC